WQREKGEVRLWDAVGGRLRRVIAYEPGARHATFSPDGRQLLTVGDTEVRLWDSASGGLVHRLTPHAEGYGFQYAGFTPDGLGTAGDDGTARVWDAATGPPLTPQLRHDTRTVWEATFLPDGRQLLTAGEDRTVRQWNTAPVQPVLPPLEHDQEVTIAFFSGD